MWRCAPADVALMCDRLERLLLAIDLSRRALGVMNANVVASLVVKGLFVLLAPFALVTLVPAVAAEVGMSLLVTLKALRLLGRAPSHGTAREPADDPAAFVDPCRSDQHDVARAPSGPP
jgi:hypothetical protein